MLFALVVEQLAAAGAHRTLGPTRERLAKMAVAAQGNADTATAAKRGCRDFEKKARASLGVRTMSGLRMLALGPPVSARFTRECATLSGRAPKVAAAWGIARQDVLPLSTAACGKHAGC